MASLVADYGESSGDSDENEDTEPKRKEETGSAQVRQEGTDFFGDNIEDSSDDSDDDKKNKKTNSEKDSTQQVEKLPNPFSQEKSKLPAPTLGAKKAVDAVPLTSPGSSVFVNPFEQAEQAKLGILEKHVRLTEAAPQKPATKQLCWKFKKGRCHLGNKCRFFHDMSNIAFGTAHSDNTDSGTGDDFQTNSHLAFTASSSEGQARVGFGRGDASYHFPGRGGAAGERQIYHPAAQYSTGQPADPRAVDEDDYMASAKGKKRFGVTDTLCPPKRAMMALGELRKKERPWTAKK